MKPILFACALVLSGPIALAAVICGPSATQTGPTTVATTEIPPALLPVYIAASYQCQGLPWQVLAAIGWTESRHGDGRVDPATGQVDPPIIGPTLDGTRGYAAIPDPTSPDGWAHALGPMQFLSTTFGAWGAVAPDRPPGSEPDPHNAWDAIYSAARYLCAGRATIDDLHAAILSYNRSEDYYRQLIDKATAYELGSDAPAGGQLLEGSGEAVVAAAMTQLGVPYVWGGTTPGVGFDCSGLVQWAYAQVGVVLPRTTFEQATIGVEIDPSDLRSGDLVFTRGAQAGGMTVDLGHVAIFAGGGMVIVAPRTGDVVNIRQLAVTKVQLARRIVR